MELMDHIYETFATLMLIVCAGFIAILLTAQFPRYFMSFLPSIEETKPLWDRVLFGLMYTVVGGFGLFCVYVIFTVN